MPYKYHLLDALEACKNLQTDPERGLSHEEAEHRLQSHGPNRLAAARTHSTFGIFLHQLANPLILLLIVSIAVSLFIGHHLDAVIIAVIVLLNSAIGFFQEYRAEKAIAAIRHLTKPQAKLLRSGQTVILPADKIVVGDIVFLEAGDSSPADLRLLEAISLEMDESTLTGESLPVAKDPKTLSQADAPLGDRFNLLFTGTHAVKGRGKGVCFATGQNTELGKIAGLLATGKKAEIPLEKRLRQLSRRLVTTAALLCAGIVLIGLWQRQRILDLLFAAITLGIAAVPEGLPAVITISLSLGAVRLSRIYVLVRHLQAVETLGAITAICTDKTGTLTQNRMSVRQIYADGKRLLSNQSPSLCSSLILPEPFIPAIVLCNSATFDGKSNSGNGDPMEIALLKFAEDAGCDVASLKKEWAQLREWPFDAARKRMSSLHRHKETLFAFMKGAPEILLELCTQERRDQDNAPLTYERRLELIGIQEEMASQGMRTLAVAFKTVAQSSVPKLDDDSLESSLIFLGLIALQDPPRPQARQAIASCRQAGIRTIMITGDHAATAKAIGRELDIFRPGDRIVSGPELAEKDETWLLSQVLNISIYARVSPQEKLTIIRALQSRGQIVAMTGDGVNDAPALKLADVGIAMGHGTDVAKEAADLILVREDFSTIVNAIREGRAIYDNIRKFVRYMLTTNFGEIAAVLLTMLAGLPIPLLPVQILWINLVTDGLPAIALGFEREEKNIMQRRPRDPKESIFARGLWQHTLWVGMLMGLISLAVFASVLRVSHDLPLARTLTFTTLVFAQMAHILAIRSESEPLWKLGLRSNYRLTAAVALTVLLQLVLIGMPTARKFFHTVWLDAGQILVCVILSAIILGAVEIEKMIKRRAQTNLRKSKPTT